MNLRYKALGLGAALAMGLGVVAPVSAQNTVDVSVNVQEDAGETISFSVLSGNAEFGNVVLEADEAATNGVLPLTPQAFEVGITGDDDLYRGAGTISIELGTDNDDAFLEYDASNPAIPSTIAGAAEFQIPGRYVYVNGVINPQQAKWTGATSTSGAIWAGSTINTPANAGRVPRATGSETSGPPIYKVGDIGGTFNSAAEGDPNCHVTTDNILVLWNDNCGDQRFSEGNESKQIAYFWDGSGFVEATETISIGLDVPAGVYPGLYSGVFTLEATFS